jgi:hypothetical protein
LNNSVPAPLRDFRNFLALVWRHLQLPDPTPIQYDIAGYLQKGPRRRVVEAFRGVGKSWITAAFVCWLLLMNPEERVLVVSANQDRSTAFSIFVRRLLTEMPILKHLAPREGQRQSNLAFDVAPASNHQAPSVKSVGITGQLAGSRASIIVADDVEIPTNSDTVAKRDKLAEAVKEFDAVLMPGGQVVYLGTPQTEESIYNKRLVDRGYDIRIWPARVPSEAQVEKYGAHLAPVILDMVHRGRPAGSSTDPARFTDADLTERELSYGRSGFALQFMLDTRMSDSERYPLRCSDFGIFACSGDMGPVRLSWASSPELAVDLPVMGFQGDRWFRPMFVSHDFADWHGCVMAIDPSGRGKDELSYAIVKMLSGNLYVAECRGLTGGYNIDNLTALSRAAKRHKVKKIVVESNFGDGMFLALLKPVLAKTYEVSMEEVRHNVQKERRIIDTLEPVMNQHRLFIDPEVIRKDADNYNDHPLERASQYSLMYQLTHITREKGSLVHDDRLDALAMAVASWVETMGKDDTRAIVEHKARKFDEELEKYMEQLGQQGFETDAKPSWIERRWD